MLQTKYWQWTACGGRQIQCYPRADIQIRIVQQRRWYCAASSLFETKSQGKADFHLVLDKKRARGQADPLPTIYVQYWSDPDERVEFICVDQTKYWLS